jgi:hypothetical protein
MILNVEWTPLGNNIYSTDSLSFCLIIPLKALANRQRFSWRFNDVSDTGDVMHYR